MRRFVWIAALLFAATGAEAQRRGNARMWDAVDCTALTQGQEGEFCDDGTTLYICRPTAAGICDTVGEWDPVASSGGGGDITAVGDCTTGSCFQSTTARHAFLSPVAGGIATFRAITEADVSDLSHTTDTDTTCLDAGVNCLFAASATEGGAATSGDSATAFFPAGELEHERGGLEADVSAYAGLIRIAAGATSNVTNLSGLNTALGSSIADGAHTAASTDDQVASEVPFTPAGNIAATDVQAALEEVDSEHTVDTFGVDEILEEGAGLTKRAQVNFIGPSVTCVDNAGATRTDCTFTDDDVPESGDFGNAADLESDGSLSIDTVAAAEMADADHGQVAWSSGVATVEGLQYGTAFPGSPATGDVFAVTDDSAAGACDSAAGSTLSLCRWSGAAWEALGDGGGGGATPDWSFQWSGAAMEPLEPAADSISPLAKDAGTNNDWLQTTFDDTTEECRKVSFEVPSDADTAGSATFTIWSKPVTPAATAAVWRIKESAIADGETDDGALGTHACATVTYSASADITERATCAVTMATLDWAASDLASVYLCRNAGDGSDNLSGDAALKRFGVSGPRT